MAANCAICYQPVDEDCHYCSGGPAESHRLHIACPDGAVATTTVTVDGKPLWNITRIEFVLDAAAGVSEAVIHLDMPELELGGTWRFVSDQPESAERA